MTTRLARSVTPRAAGVVLLLTALAAALASQTALASGAPTVPARHTGGFVPVRGTAVASPSAASNLVYHGGPVMRVNRTYAIYWQPAGYSFSPNYKTLIDRYFSDVAGAGASNADVYSVDTQYYDTTGPIANSSSFGGSVTDTHAFPTSGNPRWCGGPRTCLTDAQIRAEIGSVVAQQGWTTTLQTEFFMFTPNDVGSCDPYPSCSFSTYCAYHGFAANLIYANMPYAAYTSGCQTGQRPNGDPADDTINVTSHEHREAITDEYLDAWRDSGGAESSDKCAWTFGAPLGGSPGVEYNQVIDGSHYYVQREWSNDGSTCLLQYGSSSPPPPGAPTVTSFNPTSGPVGTNVSITGSRFTGLTGVSFGSVAATTFTLNSDTSVNATVPSGAATGPIAVTTGSGTGLSAASFTVTGGGAGAPTITSFTPTAGFANTVVTITGTNFTGATSVTLGNVAASFTVDSPTRITATTPSLHFVGSFHWSVTTANGTATSTQLFRFL
jgi:hypothetical protein